MHRVGMLKFVLGVRFKSYTAQVGVEGPFIFETKKPIAIIKQL